MVRLPTEIWRLILRQATYVPDLLSPSWDYDPRDRIWESWYSEKLERDLKLDDQLDTKYNIVQVCREWKEIGTEFLYEAIQFPPSTEDMESSRLGNLADAFLASTAHASSRSAKGYVSYGWWTKRVNLNSDYLRHGLFEHLVTLLEHCHNLEILSIASASDPVAVEINPRLLHLLESRFSHSFRRLDNYLTTDDSDAHVAPCISGLTCLNVMMHNRIPNPVDGGASFKCITTLTMHFPYSLDGLPSQWTFPALQTLSLWNVAAEDIDSLTPFVKQHQDTLLHLHISTTWSTNNGLPKLLSNAPYINSLALEKADLGSLRDWRKRELSSGSFILPGLTYLGISYKTEKRDACPWTGESLEDVLQGGFFPNLKIIRLLSEYNASSESAWPTMVEQCTSSGVQLEDRHGDIIVPERSH